MAEHRSGWSREFDESIELPDGRTLVYFRDAATYMLNLSPKERRLPAWQAAAEALLLVVELGGPTMFARIGVMRALNRQHVREFNPKGKEPHWGRPHQGVCQSGCRGEMVRGKRSGGRCFRV
ncbi:hypothetical protein [Bradyrhizobium australiense]|uniref:hypothetical protein n=1 Tax=Bradyrhizobium australiense TaxID=2721161 RepID=UPI001F42FDEB|nr:hypothetical protein [Bradyrhizobium australiense]